ncbi:hypothetical protein D3C78_795830 [compost metagenome]
MRMRRWRRSISHRLSVVESSTSSSWARACSRLLSLRASCSPMFAAAAAASASSSMLDSARGGCQLPRPISPIIRARRSIGPCSWALSWRERSHMPAKNTT